MADAARRLDPKPSDPRLNDPLNPTTAVPGVDPRIQAANEDPRVNNIPVVESRGPGNGVIIAAVVLVLAVIAYFMFAPGTNAPAPEPATTSEPAAPATPAPATPAPDAMAPAAPATPAPDAAAPATPAPDATAPAAPAQPAPATPPAN